MSLFKFTSHLPLTLSILLLIGAAQISLGALQDSQAVSKQAPAQESSLPAASDTPMTDGEREKLLEEVEDDYEKEAWATTKWNYLYHGSLYGSALFSALAAIFIQLKLDRRNRLAKHQKNIATLLAGLASLLITLNTSGEFRKIWVNHRTSKYDYERVKNYCLTPGSTSKKAREMLEEIIKSHRDRDRESSDKQQFVADFGPPHPRLANAGTAKRLCI